MSERPPAVPSCAGSCAGRGSWRARAIGIGLLVSLVPGVSARAESWSERFAAEAESVLVLGTDGGLYRAPFHLAARETLWRPEAGDHLVRVRVGPDGRTVAWLSRRADGDTTRLWMGAERPPRPRVRYSSLMPHQLGLLHFEPAVPTVEDRGFRGARFLTPSTFMRRFSVNTLEWTSEGSGVVFGASEGLAFAPIDSGQAREVSAALALDLRSLEPSSLFLVDAIVLRGGRRREDGMLLYPDLERWRLFPSAGLERAKDWTASTTSVWWTSGQTVRAVHAHTPSPGIEVHASAPVVWIEYDPIRRALAWAAGNRVLRRPEDGGAETQAVETPRAITAVLEPPIGGRRGLVAGANLHLWDPATDSVRVTPLGDFKPTSLWELSDGEVLLVAREGRGGKTVRLAHTRAGRLEPISLPKVKNPLFAQSPSRTLFVMVESSSDPPSFVHVLDPASGGWTEVSNPGITGWELLRSR